VKEQVRIRHPLPRFSLSLSTCADDSASGSLISRRQSARRLGD
jgi:hypothetical protein